MRRLLGLLRPQRTLLCAMAGLGLASIVLNVLGPKVLGDATDLVVAGFKGRMDFGALDRVLLLALGVYAVSGACYAAQGRVTTRITQRTAFRLRAELAAKLARLPLAYFDRQSRGELLSRATNDVDNVVQSLQQTIASITNSVLLVVGVLTMMVWISPLLAAITVVIVPASAYVTRMLAGRAKRDFADQWRATGGLQGHVEEMYTAHSLVRAFGRQAVSVETFGRHNDALFRSGLRAQVVSGLVQPAMAFLSNVNYVLVAVVGGLRAASGALSIGDVQALIQYSRQFGGPLTQLTSVAGILQSGVASADRVFELLDAPEEEPAPAGRVFSVGRVRFESVRFRYRSDTPLIENLSFSVEPGQTVAVVGPTGVGKTTLVNLLMRFYEVDSGRITIDGVDIATMSRERLRSRIGMVPQDTWLFGGTIAENIAYGAETATRQQIEAAALGAHADRFVRTLPDGYDTVIGERGVELSAGEAQLVTIARAFLADPVIYVLDEATSAVDTRTEVLIRRAMAELGAGRTRFVIAHRPTTIRDADVVLTLSQPDDQGDADGDHRGGDEPVQEPPRGGPPEETGEQAGAEAERREPAQAGDGGACGEVPAQRAVPRGDGSDQQDGVQVDVRIEPRHREAREYSAAP